MWNLLSATFLVAFCVSPQALSLPDKATLVATIDEIVKYQTKKLGVPGVAYGVVLDGAVALKTATGVTSETAFQIGSIAKTFAATVAVKLQLQNKLRLDQLIQELLPERCTQKQCDGITIAHLLSHSSGIPSAGINDRIEKGDPYEAIISKALRAKKICAPGTCFQYNNAAYELAREIFEKVAGVPYAELLSKELLIPLQMSKTTTTFDALKGSNNFFVPHLFRHGKFEETNHSTAYYAYPGSSVLNSTLDDMLKMASSELGNAPAVVPTEALALLHKPRIEAVDAYAWFTKPPASQRMKSQYGLGHRLLTSPDLTVVFHPGWIKGSKSLMAVFPERKLALVLLQNSESQLGFRVLEDVVRYLRTGSVK